ncbi:hypothetical protein XFF6166_340003 [Xanthomonas citri pv. fuscans]|nr:hypothetical protein XFF6166_340003 [Xanthomonas citri pv. fuscans]SOO02449.1 hypothetical protein XFF6960_620003 [Xanthomonas citri pv. fuscans]SOO06077.1 hypothetical protein XFF7767_620003 [Xanthomonas citri pv. fuscans]SOO09818.1 hypothetical protein XFF6970_470010 [Xanthomonas citri pv. fuscans]SOO13108.1 hypothetical protein XFF7766_120003 [Xanthomonas citri pv. fuscans]
MGGVVTAKMELWKSLIICMC